MAQVVGAILLSLAGFAEGTATAAAFTIAGTAVTWGYVVGTIALTAASIGLAYAMMPAPITPAAQKQNIRQSVAARRIVYGRCKVGGPIAFLDVRKRPNLSLRGLPPSYGSSPYLHSLVMLAGHEIDAVEEYWLGDHKVTITAAGLVNEDPFFTDNVRRAKLVAQLGTSTQTAHADLTATFPEWTANHRLRGVANILGLFKSVEAQNFTKVFPQGVPQMRCVIRGAKVWDPRDAAQDADDPSTWAWTTNGALIVLNYLWSDDGMRLPRELIELAIDDWCDKADAADALVALEAGGTEPRFQLCGVYEVTNFPRDVLPAMLNPMGANLRMRADGAVILDLPDYYDPTVVFTDDNILSYTDLRRAPEKGDLRNEIRARYVSPNHDFEEQEAQPWRNEDSISVDGTQSITMDLTWCPSHAQARRRMKLEAYRLNPEWIGTIVTNAYGLNAIGERLVRVQLSELGLDLVCERISFNFEPSTGRCLIGIRSMPQAAFDWDEATEEGTEPGVDEADPDTGSPAAPSGTVEEIDL